MESLLKTLAVYQFRPADLLTPAAFAHPVSRFEVRETHISWVILTGLYAYKVKKNVHLEFIDASTLERRRFLCEEELRLNRRLALDLYIDVVTITREAGGLRIGGHGPIVEYAVRMRQFDASQELSALLEGDTLEEQEFVDLARRLARFHESCAKGDVRQGFLAYDRSARYRTRQFGDSALASRWADAAARDGPARGLDPRLSA